MIMAEVKIDGGAYGFPPGMSQPSLRALLGAGYDSLEAASAATAAELLALHGMGPKGVRLLGEALAARGLALAGEAAELSTTGEPIHDSPDGWVREHIEDYVTSDGQKGHHWRGMTTLLLTTRGRKSGLLRRTALIYGRDGDNYLIVASNGGSAEHPLWYLNLAADPRVELQVGPDRFAARARTATPEEKARLWPVMAAIFPTYDRYEKKTRRDIPLVILEPEQNR